VHAEQPQTFSIQLKQAPLVPTLQQLALAQNVNLLIDDELQGTLTLKLDNVDLDQLFRSVAKIKQFNIGKITIGTSNTLCKYILLPYLNKFMKENPHTMVSIFTQSSDKTSLLLSENKIDIGLVAKPAKTQSMSYINIMEIHDIFVATPAYLSSLKHIFDKSFNPLRDGNIMLLDKNNATRRFIDNCIEGSKLHLNQSIETGNMELLIEFAKTGIGIACVIKEFIQKELEEGTLVEIEMPPDLYIPKREIVFLYDEKNFNPSLIKFISMLKK